MTIARILANGLAIFITAIVLSVIISGIVIWFLVSGHFPVKLSHFALQAAMTGALVGIGLTLATERSDPIWPVVTTALLTALLIPPVCYLVDLIIVDIAGAYGLLFIVTSSIGLAAVMMFLVTYTLGRVVNRLVRLQDR